MPFIDAILRHGLRARTAMSAALGWGLAMLAVVAGWMGWGWRGVALAVTVIVFWLLLQLSRALRILRAASARPLGQVPNAVMLHAQVHAGMRLPAILKITRSLGRKLADAPETFAWVDEAGDTVEVEFHEGCVCAWRLRRAASDA